MKDKRSHVQQLRPDAAKLKKKKKKEITWHSGNIYKDDYSIVIYNFENSKTTQKLPPPK